MKPVKSNDATDMKKRSDNQFRHKKSLGQHFLNDRNITRKIVEIAGLSEGDRVWEIGAGTGILTDAILEKECHPLVFEIDTRLCQMLLAKYSTNIDLIAGDVLNADWDLLTKGDPQIKLVANLPYQITTPFLFRFLEYMNNFSLAVIMIQKEVAERIKAGPGSKQYNQLSLKLQYYCQINYEFSVKKHLFFPVPKVDSAVISLIPRVRNTNCQNPEFFWKLVEACFQYRRKTLHNNLKGFIRADILTQVEKKFDLSLRAEKLTENDFLLLENYLFELN
ncbi:MAG: ribosomal RNA small subunit methyltransferase A [Candidatus Cloacimonetes bacterium]|nr:ribosomal RNA small subunit methyltransferase A [Candidatus Cloacimonadota bacterium]